MRGMGAWVFALILILPGLARADELGDAYKSFEKGRFDEAAKGFQSHTRKQPQDYDQLYNTGVSLYRKGDYAEAANYFDRAKQSADPAMKSRAAYNKGVAMGRLQRWDQAEAEFQEALSYDNDNAMIRDNLQQASELKKTQQQKSAKDGSQSQGNGGQQKDANEDKASQGQKDGKENAAQKDASGNMAQKDPNGNMNQKDANGNMAQKDPNGNTNQKGASGNMAQKDPNGNMNQKDASENMAQKDPNGNMNQKDASENMAQKDPNGNMNQKDANGTMAQKDANGNGTMAQKDGKDSMLQKDAQAEALTPDKKAAKSQNFAADPKGDHAAADDKGTMQLADPKGEGPGAGNGRSRVLTIKDLKRQEAEKLLRSVDDHIGSYILTPEQANTEGKSRNGKDW